MQILLSGVSKKYDKRWIFRDINLQIDLRGSLAICGPNGSGKSTLLKIIGNYHSPTKGTVRYAEEDKALDDFTAVSKMSYVGPDQHLLEELTLQEHINFHFKFRRALIPKSEMMAALGLEGAKDQFVSNFSSGMKQRLKLLLAFYSDTSVILLDEPTSYMDAAGIDWYQQVVTKAASERTIIVASNDPKEYEFTTEYLFLG